MANNADSPPSREPGITYADLVSALPKDATCAALLKALYLDKSWILKPMLEALTLEMLPAYLKDVEDIWTVMRNSKPSTTDVDRLAEGMKGLTFHSMEFLKRQIEFAKTGEYKASDYDEVYRDVYSNEVVMAQYLDGLLLTYIAWPNHYRLLNWYRDAYLSRAPAGECLEIGPGHGWLALWQLRSNHANQFLGLDISPHSVAYSRAIIGAGGVRSERWRVLECDAQKGIVNHSKRFDRVVIAEVIEHLDHPEVVVNLAREHSHSGTLFFITTVVNIEAVDHIHLFRSLDEVRDFCRDKCGLEIVDELDLPLKMKLQMSGEAYEVALICKPK